MSRPQSPGGGGGGADNSLDMLWIAAIVVVGLVGIWYFGHDYIVMVILYVRMVEVALINFVLDGINYVFSSIGFPLDIGSSLNQWESAMQAVPIERITLEQVIAYSEVVGSYLRYPLGLILLVCAWWVYHKHTALRFNNVFDVRKLRNFEVNNWPQITPVIKSNIAKMDIDEGEWAMAMTPVQFGLKHDLLIFKNINGEPRVEAKEGSAHRVFSVQLGPAWKGPRRLPIHARALFAAFAAKGNRDGDACTKLLHQIAASSGSNKLNFTGTDELLAKYENTKLVKLAMSRHGYVLTVMMSMLELARTDGVMACSDFLWLKPIDRKLWYVLNNVGRQTGFCECAGPFAHFKAENSLRRSLSVPTVEEAVKAYQLALSDILYKPEEGEG